MSMESTISNVYIAESVGFACVGTSHARYSARTACSHLNAVSAHTLEGALVDAEKKRKRDAVTNSGGVSNDGNLIDAPRIGRDRPSSNRKNRTEDKIGAQRLFSDETCSRYL